MLWRCNGFYENNIDILKNTLQDLACPKNYVFEITYSPRSSIIQLGDHHKWFN